MNSLRLPYFWSRLSFVQKAAYLCSSKQAKDYSDACSILASFRRKKRQQQQPIKPRLPYAE